MADISIIGAGSWGTALAVLLHKNGHRVTVWSVLKEKSKCWRGSMSIRINCRG